MRKIKIIYNNKTYITHPPINPLKFIEKNQLDLTNPIACTIGGNLSSLLKELHVDCHIDFIELESSEGQKIYENSLLFLFFVSLKIVFPKIDSSILHAIPGGIHLNTNSHSLSDKEVQEIQEMMKKLVKSKLPIKFSTEDWPDAIEKLNIMKRDDLLTLYNYSLKNSLNFYKLKNTEDSFSIPLAPNTNYLDSFKLTKYHHGLFLLFPDYEKRIEIPHKIHCHKLLQNYKEYTKWTESLKYRTTNQLNQFIINNEINTILKITEAYQEKKIAQISDMICHKSPIPKIILIAGPSSSGKTSFAKRLDLQLRVNHLNPISISLDNYFLDREQTPLDEHGDYDFESLNAIDIDLFNKHLNELLKGLDVIIPSFDFKTGQKSFPEKNRISLHKDQLLIIEGIHGINPKLSEKIDSKFKFKIFVCPLTQMNLHKHERITTSDTRLIRRIVRDNNFRGYSAQETIRQWKKVRYGETKYIFPFQEEADVLFNSALFYEISALKDQAEKSLFKIDPSCPTYPEAKRLLTILSYFLPIESSNIPKISILREFIGGSSFKY